MYSEPAFIKGACLIFVGAFLASSFGVILKKIRAWRWEHLWLVYSFVGMLAVPWAMGFLTVPQLLTVLRSAHGKDVVPVILYGMGWGLGAVLYGLALKRVGVALSQAIVVGLTAAVGSLAPLVLLHPEYVLTARGKVIIGGVLLIVIGVGLSAWSGQLKENRLEKKATIASSQVASESYIRGIIYAILSGLFSSMLNLSFAYGAPLAQIARAHGARVIFEANAIWTIALTAGFLVNAGYCAYLITRGNSWGVFSDQYFHYGLAILMGVLWCAGPIFYGFGSANFGELAAVVGWVLVTSLNIICANFWGGVSEEWANSGTKPFLAMLSSIVVLCIGMVVVAWGNTLG
ncbi:MAG: L-rhamnose/proton symporter RhaT [Terriglobia bacterium]|jgi:L-rhamnose-H+ transport protein